MSSSPPQQSKITQYNTSCGGKLFTIFHHYHHDRETAAPHSFSYRVQYYNANDGDVNNGEKQTKNNAFVLEYDRDDDFPADASQVHAFDVVYVDEIGVELPCVCVSHRNDAQLLTIGWINDTSACFVTAFKVRLPITATTTIIERVWLSDGPTVNVSLAQVSSSSTTTAAGAAAAAAVRKKHMYTASALAPQELLERACEENERILLVDANYQWSVQRNRRFVTWYGPAPGALMNVPDQYASTAVCAALVNDTTTTLLIGTSTNQLLYFESASLIHTLDLPARPHHIHTLDGFNGCRVSDFVYPHPHQVPPDVDKNAAVLAVMIVDYDQRVDVCLLTRSLVDTTVVTLLPLYEERAHAYQILCGNFIPHRPADQQLAFIDIVTNTVTATTKAKVVPFWTADQGIRSVTSVASSVSSALHDRFQMALTELENEEARVQAKLAMLHRGQQTLNLAPNSSSSSSSSSAAAAAPAPPAAPAARKRPCCEDGLVTIFGPDSDIDFQPMGKIALPFAPLLTTTASISSSSSPSSSASSLERVRVCGVRCVCVADQSWLLETYIQVYVKPVHHLRLLVTVPGCGWHTQSRAWLRVDASQRVVVSTRLPFHELPTTWSQVMVHVAVLCDVDYCVSVGKALLSRWPRLHQTHDFVHNILNDAHTYTHAFDYQMTLPTAGMNADQFLRMHGYVTQDRQHYVLEESTTKLLLSTATRDHDSLVITSDTVPLITQLAQAFDATAQSTSTNKVAAPKAVARVPRPQFLLGNGSMMADAAAVAVAGENSSNSSRQSNNSSIISNSGAMADNGGGGGGGGGGGVCETVAQQRARARDEMVQVIENALNGMSASKYNASDIPTLLATYIEPYYTTSWKFIQTL